MGWHGPRGSCGCCECSEPRCQCFDGCIGSFSFKFSLITDTAGDCSANCAALFPPENLWTVDCLLDTFSGQPQGVTGQEGQWTQLYDTGLLIAFCPGEVFARTVVWGRLYISGTTLTIGAQVEFYNSSVGWHYARFEWTFDISEGCVDFSGSDIYYPDSTTYGGTAPSLGCNLTLAEAELS